LTSIDDQLVQISGNVAVVKKALYSVSDFVHKHPHKEKYVIGVIGMMFYLFMPHRAVIGFFSDYLETEERTECLS